MNEQRGMYGKRWDRGRVTHNMTRADHIVHANAPESNVQNTAIKIEKPAQSVETISSSFNSNFGRLGLNREEPLRANLLQQLAQSRFNGGANFSKPASQLNQDVKGWSIFEVGDEQIQVHTASFMAHSKVFHEMVFAEDKRPKNLVIEIDNVSPKAVQKFAEFINLGMVDKVDDCAEELFILASDFEIVKLQKMCANYLVLTEDNILDRLVIAFKNDIEILEQKTVDYVLEESNVGNLKTILQSDQWTELMKCDEELSHKILNGVFEKCKLSKNG